VHQTRALGTYQRPASTLSGVVLMGARLYDPTLGRFLSLTEQWEEASAARSAMHPRSPVRALDALLRARQG